MVFQWNLSDSFIKSLEVFCVFWLISTVLHFEWSPLVFLFPISQSQYQLFWDCTECTSNNWYHRHFHVSQFFQFCLPSRKLSKLDKPDMQDTARTYIQQLCEDTVCGPEDLPETMNDREKWRERVRDILASGTTWWWWWIRSRYISLFLLSFSFTLWSAGRAKSTIRQVLIFFGVCGRVDYH